MNMITKLRKWFLSKVIEPYVWFYAFEDVNKDVISVRIMWKNTEICIVTYTKYELIDILKPKGDRDNGTKNT